RRAPRRGGVLQRAERLRQGAEVAAGAGAVAPGGGSAKPLYLQRRHHRFREEPALAFCIAALGGEMRRGSSGPDLVSFNAAMEACGASWRHSLAVFCELEKCMQADRLSYNAVLNACRHQNDIGEAIFSSALQAGAFPWLTWRGKHLLDLHDLSPGAAHFAVQWWLREVGYWKNRAPPGLEIITGQGHLRKRWAHGLPLQAAALQSLQELKASAVPAPNPGRLRVIPRARPPPPS
ncbi:unnamed protein product, partial [Effrenium voratum]